MKINNVDHVGIVVNDLPVAKAFFLELGLEVLGETVVEGTWVDRVVGLSDVESEVVMMGTPDGQTNLELTKFRSPSDKTGVQSLPANAPGIRHLAFVVEDIEAIVARLKKNGTEIFSEIQSFEDTYKLCYVRGPEGIILELAEQIK